MPRDSLQSVVQYLHRIIDVGPGAASDAELLERFATNRDESAFALLVWRHGPLVLGVCRRVLRHEHDCEDVFQATFLTLARRANSISKKDALASWLYKVAYRIACRARGKVPMLTNQPAALQGPSAEDTDVIWRDLRPVLDQEIARLPESQSRPIILCYLEGKTHEEAAELLGWPKGTLAARLARGRERLRQRLTRRGWTLSAAGLATVLAEKAGAHAISAELMRSTVQAALAYVSGTTVAVLSAKAVALAEGVLQMIWYSKVKMVVVMLLAVALTGSGVGWAMFAGGAGPEQAAQKPKAEPPADIAAMRAEIAKLRSELDAANKEIKSLKEGRADLNTSEQLYQGKPAGYWLEQLKDADPKFRAEAVDALGILARKNKELIPVLVSAMKEEISERVIVGKGKQQVSVSRRAVNALGGLGPDVLPTLLELLKGSNVLMVQRRAAQAIALMGPNAKPALPALVKSVKSDDLALCCESLRALQAIGPDAKAAIPAIMEVLELSMRNLGVFVKDGQDRNSKPMRFGLDSSDVNVMAINTLSVIDPGVEVIFPHRQGFGRPDEPSDPLLRRHIALDKSRREAVGPVWRKAVETLKRRYADMK